MRDRRDEEAEGGFTAVELTVVIGIAAAIVSMPTPGVPRASANFVFRPYAVRAMLKRDPSAGYTANDPCYTYRQRRERPGNITTNAGGMVANFIAAPAASDSAVMVGPLASAVRAGMR